MSRCRDAYAQARGFTLMEVLVAMTLLALLMAALSGSIGFVGRSWDRGWQTGEKSAALSRVEGTVRRMIERSFPASVRAEKKDRFLFEGKPGNLRLVAYDAPGGSAGGLYVQEVALLGAGSQRQLVFRQYPFRGGSARPDRVDEARMLVGDFTIAFSYYGSLRPPAPPTWLQSWTSDRFLPDLIQLRIEESSGPSWPPIIVRPAVTAEFACLPSANAGLCRLERDAP